MEADFVPFEKIKQMYPEEWVLLGNPEMKNTTVLGGIVLYHSKDKKGSLLHRQRQDTESFKGDDCVYRRLKTK